MMPQIVTVRVHSRRGRRIRLWIPVLAVLLLLSPLLLLGAIALFIGCLVVRVRPIRALFTLGRLLFSLSGTRIEFEQGHTAVLVTIR